MIIDESLLTLLAILGIAIIPAIMGVVGLVNLYDNLSIYNAKENVATVLWGLLIVCGFFLCVLSFANFHCEEFRTDKYDLGRMAVDFKISPEPTNGREHITHMTFYNLESWSYYVKEYDPAMSEYLLENES